MSSPGKPAQPSTSALGVLATSGAATAGLAVYQWLELLVVRGGGKVSCSVNETVNCATVWNSSFASMVHELLGMPVAALGVVWGLGALALTGLAWRKRMTADWPVFAAALKLWAFAGLGSIAAFAVASAQARAVCLTCLGTYALVAAFAFGAFVMLPAPRWPQTELLLGAVGWVFVVGAPLFLAMLVPGGNTPKAGQVTHLAGTTEAELIDSLSNLPQREAMLTAAARKTWLSSEARMVDDFAVRARSGGPEATVKVVEFSDVLCPHCASFEVSLEELRAVAPAGTLSVEARVFPLVDDACAMPAERGSVKYVRCLGAKALLCSEDHPLYWDVRKQIFANQQRLAKEPDLALELAAGITGRSADALRACVSSTETQAKLVADITYAKRYDIKGTPLVLVNGKKTWPSAGFILGLAVARGDVNAPWFQKLPEPPPMEAD